MSEKFQQTVNLKEKMEKKDPPSPLVTSTGRKKIVKKAVEKKVEDIDEVYNGGQDKEETKNYLQKIKLIYHWDFDEDSPSPLSVDSG